MTMQQSTKTERDIEAARNKDAVYMRVATRIQEDVPVDELTNLIQWLLRYRDSFETPVNFHEAFETFPFDGAVAFHKALKDKFGFIDHQATPGFFGNTPPQYLTVPIGPGKTIQVPWGQFGMPGYPGLVMTIGTHPAKDSYHFCISGTVKKKDMAVIDDLVTRVRQNLRDHSIYKSKAISLTFNENFDPRKFSPEDVAPEYLDLTRIDQNDLVLSDTLTRQIQDNLFSPVEKTDLCRTFKLPLRRNILLAGTYGVGKTLAAQIQALKATRNGWTFIYLKDVAHLAEGLRVARQYAPAVVFAEDIDTVVGGDERTDKINEVLNTIDGIEMKGKEVMVVMTTNHVERVNPAMLRPGRVDALIVMGPPDAKAAEKLLRVYGRDLIDTKEDLTEAGKLLAGQRPATIAEVVQRSKLSAISRMAVNETVLTVAASDLEAAAKGMQHHINLIDAKEGKKFETPAEVIGRNVLEVFNTAAVKVGNGVAAAS